MHQHQVFSCNITPNHSLGQGVKPLLWDKWEKEKTILCQDEFLKMCEEFGPHTGHADGMTEVECKYITLLSPFHSNPHERTAICGQLFS